LLVDTEDWRLTRPERETLRTIAIRLQNGVRIRRPDKYARQAAQLFGDSAENGDLEARGSITPPQPGA
jgi:hypothetical protein